MFLSEAIETFKLTNSMVIINDGEEDVFFGKGFKLKDSYLNEYIVKDIKDDSYTTILYVSE